MTYQTKWELLDKDKNVTKTFERICFSNHTDTPFYDVDHYFRYKFDNTVMDDDKIEKYFRFIRATPEFTHLMPDTIKGIKQMVADKTYTADLTTISGIQLFGILTLLRAVVEDPAIVRSVIQFNPKMKHDMPHLSIIKAAGSRHQQNSNHWLTGKVDLTNLLKGINDQDKWDDIRSAKSTGLVPGLFDVFQHEGDGYYCMTNIPPNWDKPLLKAQAAKQAKKKMDKPVAKPIVIRVKGDVYDTGHLQVAAW